jgi:hypothetical protein
LGRASSRPEQRPMTTTLKKTRNHSGDESSPAPQGDGLMVDLRSRCDRDFFLGGVNGSTTLGNPGTFTLSVTSNYSTEQCFWREQERAVLGDCDD